MRYLDRYMDRNRDRETYIEKVEHEIWTEQCAAQAKEEELKCDGLDCAWCGEVNCPREKH